MESELAQLVLLHAYREQRQHIFPSQSSLDWFLRKHREALVEHGALLLLTGRWFVSPKEFDVFMKELGSRSAYTRC